MTDLTLRLRNKADMIEMGEKIQWGSDSEIMREAAARIAELEDGLSSACEYAQKVESALKRLYDAALDIDENEMSPTEREWWREELRAARAAYRGEKE